MYSFSKCFAFKFIHIYFYRSNHWLVADSDDELSCAGYSETKLNDDNISESVQRKKEVLISSVHPLLVCSNAMKKSHKCVYCKCYECYMKELKMDQNNGKDENDTEKNNKKLDRGVRKRSSRCRKAKNISEGQRTQQKPKGTRSTIGSHNICNHTEDLTIFSDASFFSRAYKTRNEKTNRSGKDKVFLPIFCSVCKAEICNRVTPSISI